MDRRAFLLGAVTAAAAGPAVAEAASNLLPEAAPAFPVGEPSITAVLSVARQVEVEIFVASPGGWVNLSG